MKKIAVVTGVGKEIAYGLARDGYLCEQLAPLS